jgi:hypothetical protein
MNFKEFLEAINLYPWTSFFVWVAILTIVTISKADTK